MALSKALNGFVPSRRRGSGANSTGTSRYRVANAFGSNIFYGDLVTLDGGYIEVPVTTTNYVTGAFQGCEYIDSVSKQPTFSNYFPSGVSSAVGNVDAFVVDDPAATYIVQADASVSVGDINLNFDVTLGAGSAVTGISGFGIKAASRVGTTAMVRVLDIYAEPGNDFGDANPKVEVRIVQHVDADVSTHDV
jgi:hypothetical protein|tara:strand:+ start:1254 stop:1829 length:576 start_codon:yes stop_codon:yes gene_type:complete